MLLLLHALVVANIATALVSLMMQQNQCDDSVANKEYNNTAIITCVTPP